jgi:hypothetical protein
VGKKWKPFPKKSGITQGCPLSLLFLSVVLEFLVSTIMQEKEIKRVQRKKSNMMLFLKDLKTSPRNF